MPTTLKGRSVIVTGASKGIGKGIARVFASKGAQVLLAARDLAEAEAAAQEIRLAGGFASAVAADVSSEQDCARMARTAGGTPRRHRTLSVAMPASSRPPGSVR